jgi:hypothetical protein
VGDGEANRRGMVLVLNGAEVETRVRLGDAEGYMEREGEERFGSEARHWGEFVMRHRKKPKVDEDVY